MTTGADGAAAARRRVEEGLEALRAGLAPYVEKHMRARYDDEWRSYVSRAPRDNAADPLDVQALLKTLLANWSDLFRHDERLRKARSFISLALDARNAAAHYAGEMEARAALRYLDAMRELLAAVGPDGREAGALRALYDAQRTADSGPAPGPRGLGLEEPPPPERLRPWREVCEPHPDVLAARFSDAEFAANLALVDRGRGEDEYVDPAAFFRITHTTEGLRRVLRAVIERLGGRGGEPVIGLQTNFGGGKTHTMLALHHLAGALEAGYRPETLEGLAPIFAEAGVETLPPVRRAVFVGTDKGAAEAMHTEDGREIRTLWGYIAWRLGGRKAVDSIAASEKAGTNPGSEKLIPILSAAAPCLILMDEVVAFARQLRGVPYDAFHAFIQSLTEAAAAVKGAVVVGSLPESGTEVGDEQGRDALRRLEKVFGRLQSAWTPASGVETFEIVRRRLFQPLDEAGEKARDDTVRAFRKLYRSNRADFPPEALETAYEEQMRRAYPLHPEVLRRFAGDWSVLDKFQRTRGILKIMAGAVYALWQGESAAPLITPALLPFRDARVRTALLEPLDRAYGPILQTEVDGDQALTARIEGRRPRIGRIRAATGAARALFFATAPHSGDARGGITGAELRLACARPGDQIAVFGEALQQLASDAAYLYRDGDRYWFSPRATLNKLAADRARDVSAESADRRIVELLREEARDRGGFHRAHAAPDRLTDIGDERDAALVILPPSGAHDGGGETRSPAEALARDAVERRGAGQRRYRNALIFVAADAANIEAARENARRERAWRSILDDRGLRENMTQSQADDAKSQFDRAGEALRRSVRSAWVHLLCPAAEGANGGRGSGFALHAARLVNRGGAKSVARAAWDKASGDGAVLGEIGPENLVRCLKPIWPEDRPHIPVEELRQWFASYVYLPRLRDEAVLDAALRRLAEDLAFPFALAAGFDAESGAYADVVDGGGAPPGGLGSRLLARREAIPARPEVPSAPAPSPSPPGGGVSGGMGKGAGPEPGKPPTPAASKPKKRFFASLKLDPDRPVRDIGRIADDLLVELTRAPGARIELTLEIEGAADESGYPPDIMETVTANARDLNLDADLGFEED